MAAPTRLLHFYDFYYIEKQSRRRQDPPFPGLLFLYAGMKGVLFQLLMIDKNMNGQEKYHGDGDAAVEDQDNGKLIQDHAK